MTNDEWQMANGWRFGGWVGDQPRSQPNLGLEERSHMGGGAGLPRIATRNEAMGPPGTAQTSG
jgi:hypothetical protein